MDKKMIALVDQMVSLMQQAVYSVPGGESKELSGELIANGDDDYVVAIYIVDYVYFLDYQCHSILSFFHHN